MNTEWQQLDADKYKKSTTESEREYLVVNRDFDRITYIYKYFVLESEDLYEEFKAEPDIKTKYSTKYGHWVSERAYVDRDTAQLMTKIFEEIK